MVRRRVCVFTLCVCSYPVTVAFFDEASLAVPAPVRRQNTETVGTRNHRHQFVRLQGQPVLPQERIPILARQRDAVRTALGRIPTRLKAQHPHTLASRYGTHLPVEVHARDFRQKTKTSLRSDQEGLLVATAREQRRIRHLVHLRGQKARRGGSSTASAALCVLDTRFHGQLPLVPGHELAS